VPEFPEDESRRSSVVAACVATLPRRLLILGGFVVLGWLGLALLNATNASAAPTNGAAPGAAAAAEPTLLTVPDLSPLPVVGQPTTARSAINPARPTAAVKPADAKSAAGATSADQPASQQLAATSLGTVLTPVTSALAVPPSASGAPLAPLADATSKLLPILARTGDALSPHSGQPSTFDPSMLLPALRNLFGLNATPGPSGPPHHAPVSSPRASTLTSATSRVLHADPSAQLSSPSRFRPADESLFATPAPASAPHGQLAGLGIPAPLPALPPVGPDTVFGTGSGSAATSSTGTGTSLSSGYGTADVYPHDVPLLGPAESARTRPVRDSATEPPVSPD
jgi:hypothetical protein